MKFALVAKNRMFPDRSGWANQIKVLGAEVFARITADVRLATGPGPSVHPYPPPFGSGMTRPMPLSYPATLSR